MFLFNKQFLPGHDIKLPTELDLQLVDLMGKMWLDYQSSDLVKINTQTD